MQVLSRTFSHDSIGRRRWPEMLAVAAAGLTLVLPPSGLAQESESTPTAMGVLGEAVSVESCNLDDYAAAPDGTASLYRIVSDDSEARYVAQEELARVGAATAIGRTSAFIGQIGFDEEGNPLACSRFDVDLRTLTSDSAMRDNHLYRNTLETATYPLATFILTGVEGLEGPIADGEETELTLIGNLTVHGVTNSVAWQATVTREGDLLTGNAETTFRMPEFDIVAPIVGQVISIEETITLQVDIAATLADE